jgi:hypothetical protein
MIDPYSYEDLYKKVKEHIEAKGFFSISDVQRKFKISLFKAKVLRDDFERCEIIEKGNGTNPQYTVKREAQ